MRFVFALFAALAAAAPLSAGVQVEFTSTPEAAGVFIDGRLRGSTPLVLRGAELEVGRRHHLRFSKEGYEDVDMFFAARDGDRFVQHAELVPQKGLLLVTTEPEGAEISRDGYSLGTTPRLVTSLNAKDVHTLVIRKAGYQDRKLEVRFNGRRPLVRNVSLVLDSGVLKIGSSPAGAEVTVNGISRGPAPVTVTGIPKGRVALSVKKEGYRPFMREISVNAGDEQDIFAELVPLPGALAITTVPEGARVYVDGEFRGKSPVSVADLSPRQYRVKVELDGFYASRPCLVRVVDLADYVFVRAVDPDIFLSIRPGVSEVRLSEVEMRIAVIDIRAAQWVGPFASRLPIDNGESRMVCKRDGRRKRYRRESRVRQRSCQLAGKNAARRGSFRITRHIGIYGYLVRRRREKIVHADRSELLVPS